MKKHAPILDFIHNRDHWSMEIMSFDDDFTTTYIRMSLDDFGIWCMHNQVSIPGDQDNLIIRNKGTGVYRRFFKKDTYEWVHDNDWEQPYSRSRHIVFQVIP